MKLYDMQAAPNPRRVRIFLAEKDITVPVVPVDMSKGEHKSADFLAMNPRGKIPVLELDNGDSISESVAICRYFEALNPHPALFGDSPEDQGRVEMWNRRMELELFSPVGQSWVNGPVVAKIAAGRFEQIPAAKTQADERVHAYYSILNEELANKTFMAGDNYSIADITGFCVIDFARHLVGLPPGEELQHLWRWHAEMEARPSAKA